ncbi:unnamed protein product [Acanthosepion pharaonis]|uniref:Uncharacterized protein n=1 Tax=Acanthosepion pharaonis TaxID=158019 RepID=A0A812EHA9_ACAPH|nr:unnamed protein product [Sepia pharaonis]
MIFSSSFCISMSVSLCHNDILLIVLLISVTMIFSSSFCISMSVSISVSHVCIFLSMIFSHRSVSPCLYPSVTMIFSSSFCISMSVSSLIFSLIVLYLHVCITLSMIFSSSFCISMSVSLCHNDILLILLYLHVCILCHCHPFISHVSLFSLSSFCISMSVSLCPMIFSHRSVSPSVSLCHNDILLILLYLHVCITLSQ